MGFLLICKLTFFDAFKIWNDFFGGVTKTTKNDLPGDNEQLPVHALENDYFKELGTLSLNLLNFL